MEFKVGIGREVFRVFLFLFIYNDRGIRIGYGVRLCSWNDTLFIFT